MTIWFRPVSFDDVNSPTQMHLPKHLGIEFTEIGPDFLRARMPVNEFTRQPYGILHGGASVVLAETLASFGANFCVDPTRYRCVGQEINANHIRAVSSGWVIGTARPLHLGKQSQVWEVRIEDEKNRLVCISRMTAFVIDLHAREAKA